LLLAAVGGVIVHRGLLMLAVTRQGKVDVEGRFFGPLRSAHALASSMAAA
jgi:hypothetical protein